MKLDFYKYQGAGNDFIIIDNRKGSFPKTNIALIKKMCDRHFGIGSDGLILIEKSNSTDFYMEFFNPDGSQSFCGNGSRCAVLFCYHLGIISKNCQFNSLNGLNTAQIMSHDNVKISMYDVPINAIEQYDNALLINTGSPHYIKFIDSFNTFNLLEEAHKIRYNDRFKAQGVNVNFITLNSASNSLNIRTYERGVENETLACGTGVTAAALAHCVLNKSATNSQKVVALGGDLWVHFEKNNSHFHSIFLEGPARYVFKGEIDVHN